MERLSNLKGKLLAEQAGEELLSYIKENKLAAGDRLPNEFALGELFGVGRSTVREAVKALVSRGVLKIRRGSGTYVVRPEPAADPLGLAGMEDKEALALDLAEVRLMVEPAMAELAAQKAAPEELARLEALCEAVERKIRRGETYAEEDIAFHRCVAGCSGNRIVGQLLPIIDTAVMMFMNLTHKTLREETVRTHRDILRAIRERDPLGARLAMTMHLTYNREAILRLGQRGKIKTEKTKKMDMTGEADLAGKVDVTGEADLAGKVDVTGEADLAGKVDVTGEADLAGKVDVTGEADLAGKVDVTGEFGRGGGT